MKGLSMAERKRRHGAHVKAGDSNKAEQLRIRTRAYCSVHNLPVPKWATAAPRTRAPKPEPAPQENAALPATPPLAPMPFTPGKPLELPRVLREWRAAAGDRAVSIASDGSVTLLRSTFNGKQKATFPSLEAAAAALEPPINWQTVHAVVSSWGHHAARGTKASAAAARAAT